MNNISKKKLFLIILLTSILTFLATLLLMGFAVAKMDVKLDDAEPLCKRNRRHKTIRRRNQRNGKIPRRPTFHLS